MTMKIISGNVIPAVTGGVFDFTTVTETPSNTILNSPAYILASYLIENGIADVTHPDSNDDWPLFVSRTPNKPTNCCVIYDTTPNKDLRYMSGQVIEHYGLQMKVRSNSHIEGWVKLETLNKMIDEINNDVIIVNDIEYLIQNVSRNSGVISLGAEEDAPERRLFTSNYLMTLRNYLI